MHFWRKVGGVYFGSESGGIFEKESEVGRNDGYNSFIKSDAKETKKRELF